MKVLPYLDAELAINAENITLQEERWVVEDKVYYRFFADFNFGEDKVLIRPGTNFRTSNFALVGIEDSNYFWRCRIIIAQDDMLINAMVPQEYASELFRRSIYRKPSSIRMQLTGKLFAEEINYALSDMGVTYFLKPLLSEDDSSYSQFSIKNITVSY